MHKLLRLTFALLLTLALMSCGDQMEDQNNGGGGAGNVEELEDTTRLDAARGGNTATGTMPDTNDTNGMMDTFDTMRIDTIDTIPDGL